MKIIILILFLILSNIAYSQSIWNLSNNGISSTYCVQDFATSLNVDVYAACNNLVTSNTPIKIYKSSNNGSNWSVLSSSGLTNLSMPHSIIFSGNKMLMSVYNYVNSIQEVYTSNDNGLSWILSNSGIPSNYCVQDFATSSNGNIYAACNNLAISNAPIKIYKSSNNGSNWSVISTSGLTSLSMPHSIIFSGNKMLMSVYNYVNSTHEVYASNYNTNSIINILLEDHFEIFPNPVTDIINIKNISLQDIKIDKIEILSLDGSIIKKIYKDFSTINISDIPNGVYILKLHYNNNFYQVKIVKN